MGISSSAAATTFCHQRDPSFCVSGTSFMTTTRVCFMTTTRVWTTSRRRRPSYSRISIEAPLSSTALSNLPLLRTRRHRTLHHTQHFRLHRLHRCVDLDDKALRGGPLLCWHLSVVAAAPPHAPPASLCKIAGYSHAPSSRFSRSELMS
jgi:hypothetical protein